MGKHLFKMKKIISEQQMEIDKMSFDFCNIVKLISIQDISETNVFFIAGISPLILSNDVIDFFYKNKKHFKRKLTIEEIFHYDSIISHLKPRTISELKELL